MYLIISFICIIFNNKFNHNYNNNINFIYIAKYIHKLTILIYLFLRSDFPALCVAENENNCQTSHSIVCKQWSFFSFGLFLRQSSKIQNVSISESTSSSSRDCTSLWWKVNRTFFTVLNCQEKKQCMGVSQFITKDSKKCRHVKSSLLIILQQLLYKNGQIHKRTGRVLFGGGGGEAEFSCPNLFPLLAENQVVLPEYYLIFCQKFAIWNIL